MAAPYAEPEYAVFGVQSDATRTAQACAEVRTPEMFIGQVPVQGGLFSLHMGTTDMRSRCNTCGNSRSRCPGHPGVIALPFPVISPIAVPETRHWLRVVCVYCSALYVDPRDNPRIACAPAGVRLATAATIVASADVVVCRVCGQTRPKIVKDEDDRFSFFIMRPRRDGTVAKELLLPFQLALVFERVSDEAVAALGRNPENAHPRHLLIYNLQVPPVSIRPALRMVGPGGPSTSCHDINGVLQYIAKAAIDRGAGAVALGEAVSDELVDQTRTLSQLVFDLLVGTNASPTGGGKRRGIVTGTRPVESIGRRLPQKGGRGRKTLVGKRTWVVARDTISGRNTLQIHQVGVPEKLARALQVVETVSPANVARLTRFFLNGRSQYPGATRVWRAATRAVHDAAELRGVRLEPGDRIHRDLVSGDLACFNRQPSLSREAINVHEVVVLREAFGDTTLPAPPRQKTFQMNVGVTPYYNADFDGDEMNLFPLTHPGIRAEAGKLKSVERGFISTKNSAPVTGTIQDSTVGIGLVTLEGVSGAPAEGGGDGVQLDKASAMMLFERSKVAPDFSDMRAGDTVSGREAVSRLLRTAPVSLARKPTWASELAEAYVGLDPRDARTTVVNGTLSGGPLDKATVGGGAVGGVLHRISRTFGSGRALKMLFAIQQVATSFLNMRGLSIGTADMLVPEAKQAEVREIVGEMVRKSELINEQLDAGQIMPPLRMTTREFYEQQQREALMVPDNVLGPILSAIDPATNGLYQLISTGAKGNPMNIVHISGVIGQITINSRRIEAGQTGRTLAYFPRGDPSPEASGFIAGNYINGLTAVEHYMGSIIGRNDLTNKALSTAMTGYANRRAVMALQSAVADSTRAVCMPGVVQFLYGEDGLDARQVEPVNYGPASMSDAEVREAFGLGDGAGNRDEVDRILADRDEYRGVFLTTEQVDFSSTFSGVALSAVNVREIARDVFGGGEAAAPAPPAAALAEMRRAVSAFCDDLPYLYLNERQRAARAHVPGFMRAGVAHLGRLVRAELASVRLAAFGATLETLQLVFDAVRLRFFRSLVSPGEAVGVLAAQAVSEPLTQYMLDSHHRSVAGGTNKSGIVRPQEIMGAQPVEKEKSPEMLLRGRLPGPDGKMYITNDSAILLELADRIKLLSLEQLTERWEMLYETFPAAGELEAGRPEDADAFYPAFVGDWKWMRENLRANPLLAPPANLTSWCFRFTLDRMRLVMKSISLETVVTRLREKFPYIYLVHTPEAAAAGGSDVVLRVYLAETAFRRSSSTRAASPEKIAREVFDLVFGTPLRGIPGITDARVVELPRHSVKTSGPDAGKIVAETVRAIRTVGTNIHGALLHSRIDPSSIVTSSIGDTCKMLGIEAARTRIMLEIERVLGGKKAPNNRHIQIYADMMTRTGVHTSMEISGIVKREPDNIMLASLAHGPVNAFTRGAFQNIANPNIGIATPLMLGAVPRIGTGLGNLGVDSDFVASQRESVHDLITDL